MQRVVIGRPILLKIAEAVGSHHPDLLRAHFFTQGLEHTHPIVEQVDLFVDSEWVWQNSG